MLIGSIAALAAWLVPCVILERRAQQKRHLRAAEEWRLHKLAIAATAIPLALAWPVFSLAFDAQQAFESAVLIAPGTMMTLGILVVIWRRQRATEIA